MESTKVVFKAHLEFIVILVTIIGAFIWVRTESRSDYRSLDSKFDSLTKELHDWNMNFQGRLSGLEVKVNKLEEKK